VPDSESKSEVSAQPGLLTVLLVEDNPTDVFVIKEALARTGLNIDLRIATNGHEALLYLESLVVAEKPCPALVLLDLNLPKIGGIEVLRHLRSTSPCSRTPVIVVTSSTAETDRAAVRRLGAEAYFEKPSSLSAYMELGEVVKRFLPKPGGQQ
jgi:CheY-like chemotaxis protein